MKTIRCILVLSFALTLAQAQASAVFGVDDEVVTVLGTSHHAGPGLSSTLVDISPRDGRFEAILFKAYNGDYRIARIDVRSVDGFQHSFAGFDLKDGEVQRIDLSEAFNEKGVFLRAVIVHGGSSALGQIQISGVGEGRADSDWNSRSFIHSL